MGEREKPFGDGEVTNGNSVRTIKDYSGMRFGFLVVVRRMPSRLRFGAQWLCRCDCGKEKVIHAKNFVNGHVIGCGCRMGGLKHGLSFTKTHRAWSSMKSRCTNPRVSSYKRYGGRGISVCERWSSFEVFLHDMGQAPAGMTLERKNNDGNYEPSNCKWATPKEQHNNRSNNRKVLFRGEVKTPTQWAEQFGKKPQVVRYRIKHGWLIEDALFTPPKPRNEDCVLTFNGQTKTRKEWACQIGISCNALAQRLHEKWPLERALNMQRDLSRNL